MTKTLALRSMPLATAVCLALSTGPTLAQTAPPAKKPAPVKPAAKPANSAPAGPANAANAAATARSQARAGQLARDTVEQVNAAQLDVAARVLTGTADCEFNQKVAIDPIDGKAGHFRVRHGKNSFTMVPQETSTGAVRLEDKKAGMVWLQIPAKSMLMNAKIGQRVADACTLSEQRAAVTAVQEATSGAAAAAAAPAAPAASQ